MKKSLKRIIIILILLLLVVGIIFLMISRKENNNRINDYSLDSQGVNDNFIEEKKGLSYEENHNRYYTLMKIINKYISYASKNDTDSLLLMFDNKYIDKYNITESNLMEMVGIPKLERDSEYHKFNALKVLSFDNKTITVHFIYGEYYNIADLERHELNLMIELDTINQTFNIYNYQYMIDNKYTELKEGDFPDVNIKEIENRTGNKFNYSYVSQEEMAKNYLDNYKDLIFYNKEEAYNRLENEYSNLKFENFEEFNKYIDSKRLELFTANLKEYKVEYSAEGKKMYICKDQRDNYYYFIENDAIMEYEVRLDNYVMANQDSINKYNQLNSEEKVIINIDKFIKAINDKSYYFAYNCLAQSFKDNYFKTREDFENYIENNFYKENKINYKTVDEQSGLYKYQVEIINSDNNQESKVKTFIMKLEDSGTGFQISFNI